MGWAVFASQPSEMSPFGWTACFMPKDREQTLTPSDLCGAGRSIDKQVGVQPYFWPRDAQLPHPCWCFTCRAGSSVRARLGWAQGCFSHCSGAGWCLYWAWVGSRRMDALQWGNPSKNSLGANLNELGIWFVSSLCLVVPCLGMPHCCAMPASWVAPWDFSGHFQSILGKLDHTGWAAQNKFWEGLGNQHSIRTNCVSVRPGNDEMRSSEVWPWRSCPSTYQKLPLAERQGVKGF